MSVFMAQFCSSQWASHLVLNRPICPIFFQSFITAITTYYTQTQNHSSLLRLRCTCIVHHPSFCASFISSQSHCELLMRAIVAICLNAGQYYTYKTSCKNAFFPFSYRRVRERKRDRDRDGVHILPNDDDHQWMGTQRAFNKKENYVML